ncbi:MAG: hypothetical protein ABI382_03010 [Nakamurella sp.]
MSAASNVPTASTVVTSIVAVVALPLELLAMVSDSPIAAWMIASRASA